MSNTEIVKWIEIWLDSASERAYQPALVSALTHQGYKIIHNTSHNLLELGKDVICFDKSGNLLALQLKGNPGRRLTISQWHELHNQILQLVTMPVPRSLSGQARAKHIPILVTNGEVEEAVHAAIGIFNSEFVPQYPSAKPLEVWSRGQLIDLLAKTATSVWPTDLKTQISILRSITTSPKNSIDLSEFQEIILNTIKWDSEKTPSTQSIERACGLWAIVSIYASKYVEIANLYEVIKAKTIAICVIAGYWDRQKKITNNHRRVFSLMRNDIMSDVGRFSVGVARKFADRPFINDNVMTEFGIQAPRRMLVSAILAAYALERGRATEDEVRAALSASVDYPFLEAEGIVPAFLAVFWAKEKLFATRQNESELMSVMNTLIKSSQTGSNISSYYRLEDAIECRYSSYLGRAWHQINRENRRNMSQFSYVINLMLVRRNWKQTVKYFWPELTRVMRQNTILNNPSEFGLFRSNSARELHEITNLPKSWNDLTIESSVKSDFFVPNFLKRDPVLIILLILFFPHRANEQIVLGLDQTLCEAWY